MTQEDVTRLNRTERRKFKGIKIPGRNMPYVASVHKSVKAYNVLREKEMIVEQKLHEHKAD